MSIKLLIQALTVLLPVSCLAISDVRGAGGIDLESYAAAAFDTDHSARTETQTLKFNADGRFKIVQFTDIHYVPGSPASATAIERMNEVLDAERPDFVIYTGDLIFGRPAADGLAKSLAPVVSRGIPFAVTLGNHDDEYDMTRREIFDFIARVPGNMSASVEGLSGVTNFVIPIDGSRRPEDAFALYVFDSHGYSRGLLKGYDWIKDDQIAWYRRQSAAMTAANDGHPLPSLAFFHIPLPEFNLAAADESAPLIGIRGEKSCSPAVNSGLFAAMHEQGDVMGAFVGHDHVNDYATLWNGILLGYGRFTGGATVYHNIPGGNGARVFELTEGRRSFRTWIRLSSGRVIAPIDFPANFTKEN